MEEFLQYLIAKIITDDKALHIEKQEDPYGITYAISVAPEDFGKIIGKKGKTINAIRTIFNIYLYKHTIPESKKVFLKVVENV